MRLPRLNLIRNKRDILRRPSTAHLLLRPVNAVVLAAGLATGVLLELLAPQPHPAGLAQAQTLWCGDDICSPEIGEEYYNCADCLSSCNWCTDGAFCDAIMPEDEWWFVPGFKGCSTEGCCIHIPPPDGTPPVTTATLDGTAGLSGWFLSPVTVTLTATDDQSGVYSTALDGTPYTGPRLYDAEGATTIAYQSYDNRGNLEPLKSTTFYIDTIAPTTTVALPPVSGEWHHGEVLLAGTALDATSGLAGVEVSLDKGVTWLPATGGEVWTYTWDTRTVPDGMVGVLLRGSDQAGNVEAPVNFAIGVDNSNPFFDVGPFPGEHCFGCSGPVTFTLTAFDDQSRIDNTAIVVKQNGKDVRVLKAPNGELRGVPVVWDGRDDQGQPVPPGGYQLLFYTANHAGLFGSFGAGIRVVDALPASPPTTSPVIPVNPPDNPPWILTPIPPAPVVPASGETTGPAAASTSAPQTNTSNSTSSTTGATGGASTGQIGAVGTGLGALAALAAAYIAARQSMGDKSLGQKLAELAGSWKPAAKPAAPPVPKVAPPQAPPPPPPAPPRPKMLRWDQIAHTPPAPPPPPKPIYYPPPAAAKPAKAKFEWFKSSKPPIATYAKQWLSGMGRSPVFKKTVAGVKSVSGSITSMLARPKSPVAAKTVAAQPAKPGGLFGGVLGALGASKPVQQPKPQAPAKLDGLFGGLANAVKKVTTTVSKVVQDKVVGSAKKAAQGLSSAIGQAASYVASTGSAVLEGMVYGRYLPKVLSTVKQMGGDKAGAKAACIRGFVLEDMWLTKVNSNPLNLIKKGMAWLNPVRNAKGLDGKLLTLGERIGVQLKSIGPKSLKRSIQSGITRCANLAKELAKKGQELIVTDEVVEEIAEKARTGNVRSARITGQAADDLTEEALAIARGSAKGFSTKTVLSTIGKAAGKAAAIGAVVEGLFSGVQNAVDYSQGKIDKQTAVADTVVDIAGAAASAAAGAAAGAAIGSIFPGVGTVVGAALGFAVSFGVSMIAQGAFDAYVKKPAVAGLTGLLKSVWP